MLPVKEILCTLLAKCAAEMSGGESTCISRVQLHRFESLILFQHRARPFPHSAHVAPTAQLAAILGYGHRVEMLESHIAVLEICKKLMGVQTLLGIGKALMRRV